MENGVAADAAAVLRGWELFAEDYGGSRTAAKMPSAHVRSPGGRPGACRAKNLPQGAHRSAGRRRCELPAPEAERDEIARKVAERRDTYALFRYLLRV